jgi:DNA mismatch repair protein MSH4
VIIDELGRGTSSRDGLAIALSVAEALVDSGAIIFFATHFRELGLAHSQDPVTTINHSLAQILNEREGVVNMHLTVKMTSNSMTMLYKLGNGYVQEARYGLELAKTINLPPKVLEIAKVVSHALEQQSAAKKQSSKALAITKRRKLLLDLRAQLQSLSNGSLDEKPLRDFLKKLQDEFVTRMEAIQCVDESNASDGDIDGKSVVSMERTGNASDHESSHSQSD